MIDSLVVNVAVPGNGQIQWGLVPADESWRPINIGGDAGIPVGAYNLDAFVGQTNDGDMFYLDSTQNRGDPFDFSLNHQGWLEPLTQLNLIVSNWTVLGLLIVRMWYEQISLRKDNEPVNPLVDITEQLHNVSIKESIELRTKPRIWPW